MDRQEHRDPSYTHSDEDGLEYIRATMAAAQKRKGVSPVFNEQGELIDENGEPIRLVIDPPDVFHVHYTDLARHQLFWLCQPEWAVVYARLPELLAQGHDGKYAVVEGDKMVVVADRLDALTAVDQRPFGVARYYPIHEYYPLGRRTPRIRRCRATSSPSNRTD